MNTNDPLADPAWTKLIQRARADIPPEVDVAALVREVRAATLTPTPVSGWWTELAALFEIRGALPACLSAICLLAAFALWQSWQAWEQVVPWVQFLIAQGNLTSPGLL